MTDCELLVAAAKAADLVGEMQPDDIGFWIGGDEGRRSGDCWNPLTDDGAALRLAVKLRMNLIFEAWDGAEYACAVPHKSHQGHDEVIDDDESAAARRAIVRAAAAQATSKPPNVGIDRTP